MEFFQGIISKAISETILTMTWWLIGIILWGLFMYGPIIMDLVDPFLSKFRRKKKREGK